MKQVIGLSLSRCVIEIVEGKVPLRRVTKIIAATRSPDRKEWRKILRNYREQVWFNYPEKATRIAWRLINSGRVEQPRLNTPDAWRVPDVENGSLWVSEESEILWREFGTLRDNP